MQPQPEVAIVLSNLLPGVREIRTPLAAGYLLLLAGVALLHEKLFVPIAPNGLFGHLRSAFSALGTTALIAVLSFAAYVIGIVWQVVWQWLAGRMAVRIASRDLKDVYRTLPNAALAGVTRGTIRDVLNLAAFRLQKELGRPNSELSRSRSNFAASLGKVADLATTSRASNEENLLAVGAKALLASAVEDLIEIVPVRLRSRERESWLIWDQARSEAEFRSTIALPIGAVFVAVAIEGGAWWSCGLVATPLLLVVAFRRAAAATSTLVEVVRAERVQLLEASAMPEVQWNVRAGSPGTPGLDITADTIGFSICAAHSMSGAPNG